MSMGGRGNEQQAPLFEGAFRWSDFGFIGRGIRFLTLKPHTRSICMACPDAMPVPLKKHYVGAGHA